MNLIEQIRVNDVSIDGYQGTYYSENPEWVKVITDSEDKVLAGIKADGTVEWSAGVPTPIKDYVKEQLDLKVDKEENKSLIDSSIAESMFSIDSLEYLQVTTDIEDKIVMGIKPNGAVYIPILENDSIDMKVDDAIERIDASVNEKMSEIGAVADYFSEIEDPEGRSEITTDSNDKVVSYRKEDGTKVENVGIESPKIATDSLNLSDGGMTEFQKALRDSGFQPGGAGDFTDKPSMQIPIPRLAFVNITAPNSNAVWPDTKTNDYKYYMEFYDGVGNYFKKEIILNAQGNSSMAFVKKNGSVDFCNNNGWDDDDTFSIRFGDWVPQDSFHFKAYYTDFLRGSSVIAYKISEEVYKTRGVYKDRPWKKALIDFDKINVSTPANLSEDGINDISLQIDNGARCMPDGFPVIVHLNGNFYGIYSWQIKKHRDNYHMNKKTAEHIHLDGSISTGSLWGGTVHWGAFEIRNPKSLYCMDGTKYDGDNPKELIDSTSEFYDSSNKDHKNTAKVKKYIIDLSNRVSEINTLNSSDANAAKELFDTYFDAENLIDYQLINMAVNDPDAFLKNWQWITYDGVKWYVCQYDKDMSFGNHWTGAHTRGASSGGWINNDTALPTGLAIRYYKEEHKSRWNELVSAGVFKDSTFKNLINDWVSRIGQEYYAKEWSRWNQSPCNRDSLIDFDNWVFTGSERSEEVYSERWDNETEYQTGDMVWFKGFQDTWYYRFKAVQPNANKPCLNAFDTDNWKIIGYYTTQPEGNVWDKNTIYQTGDSVVYAFRSSSQWYKFEALKENNNKCPYIGYTVAPMAMGYRDSVWRYFKFIEATLSNQTIFINSL